MAYEIVISRQVQKQLESLPKIVWKSVSDAIDRLSEEPRPSTSRKLQGQMDSWRIRVGDYRIIYTIEDNRLVVLILKVGHRREVYRGQS